MKRTRKKYITVALGGTFDHFHDGHKAFIDAAAKMGDRLLIGVAGKKLTHTKSHQALVEPLKKRFRSVGHYCRSQGHTVELVELDDIYGPTIDPDVKIDALFVTTETVEGAKKIAVIREQLKLKTLPVHIVDLIPAEDGQPIHAARIRAGEISRSGRVYAKLFETDLVLNEKQRQEFGKMQGKLVLEPSASPALNIVVGDSTLEKFLDQHYKISIGIFDGHCEREVYPSELISKLKVTSTIQNPAGSITTSAVAALSNAIHASHPSYIKVEGEEDLVAVAAILVAPLGSLVYYGQPKQGMVEMQASERMKDHFYNILSQ